MQRFLKDETGGAPLTIPGALVLCGIVVLAYVMIESSAENRTGFKSVSSGFSGKSCASTVVGQGFGDSNCSVGFDGVRSDSIVFLKAKK